MCLRLKVQLSITLANPLSWTKWLKKKDYGYSFPRIPKALVTQKLSSETCEQESKEIQQI